MFGMAERHHHRLMSWKLNFAIPRSSHNELTRLRSSTTTQLVNTSPWIHSKQARKGFSVRVKKRLDEEERKSMSWEPGIPCGVLERFIFEFTRHDVDFRWLMYVYVDFLTDEIVFSNGWLWKDGCRRQLPLDTFRVEYSCPLPNNDDRPRLRFALSSGPLFRLSSWMTKAFTGENTTRVSSARPSNLSQSNRRFT